MNYIITLAMSINSKHIRFSIVLEAKTFLFFVIESFSILFLETEKRQIELFFLFSWFITKSNKSCSEGLNVNAICGEIQGTKKIGEKLERDQTSFEQNIEQHFRKLISNKQRLEVLLFEKMFKVLNKKLGSPSLCFKFWIQSQDSFEKWLSLIRLFLLEQKTIIEIIGKN